MVPILASDALAKLTVRAASRREGIASSEIISILVILKLAKLSAPLRFPLRDSALKKATNERKCCT